MPTATAPVVPRLAGVPSRDDAANALAARLGLDLNEGQVDAALSLFAQDAEVKIPPDRYVGLTHIRVWLQYLAASRFTSEPGLRLTADGETRWQLEIHSDPLTRMGIDALDGVATMAMSQRHITRYTFVLTSDSISRLKLAKARFAEISQDPLVVGIDNANVYGPTDVFHDAQNRLLTYRDVVSSDPDAGPFTDLGGQIVTIRSGF